MEDEISGRTADQQLFDANDTLYERFVQLIDDADQILRNAGEVSAQYRPAADELTDECMKAKALLHRVAVLIREGAKTESDKLRKPLEEALAKGRRSTVDVKKDFDMISGKKKKADILNYELRRLQYFFKALDPGSVYGDIQFIDVGAEQLKNEYDELLNGMSAEVEDENVLCEAVNNFNTEMNAICDLLSREPTKEKIENVEKLQLPTLRAQLAMLKDIYDETIHVRKHVDPDFSRFATLEDRMTSLNSMLEDAKKALEKNGKTMIAAMIAARLSQLKTFVNLGLLEFPEDSLNGMEKQLQNLPKDQADELQRQIEELRGAKQDFDFVRGTSLAPVEDPTPVEDATAVIPTAQDIPHNNSSRVKAASSNGVSGTVPDLTLTSLPWPVVSPVMNVPHFDLATYCLVNLDVAPSRDVKGFDLPLADVTTLRFFFNLGVQHSRSLAATQLYQEKVAHVVMSSAPSVAQTAQFSPPQAPRVPEVGIQPRITMEDVFPRRAANQQLTDAMDITERLAQLCINCDLLLKDAEGDPERYRPAAEELAVECNKAALLLHDAPESHFAVQALRTVFFEAQGMLPLLQGRAYNWDTFVRMREGVKIELDNLGKLLDETSAKPRRSAVNVKKDFDVVSEERKKTDMLNFKVCELRMLSKILYFKSAYADVRSVEVSVEQMEKQYAEILNEILAEIMEENLLCEAVINFNTKMNAICNLLFWEPTKDDIEDAEKFQLPTLRAELAMLKKEYDEANHARKHVDPDYYRFAVLENRIESLDSMLEDAKEAVEKNEQEQFLELPQDSLNEMDSKLQNLPKDQTDELERRIAELIDRSESKQHFDCFRGTSLTHFEDATAAIPTAQNNSSQVKNAAKLVMDTMCLPASRHSLKVEVQVRDGPPGEALILTHSDAGYCEAKQKFCGFEWEAKPSIHEDHVAITVCCTPEVETDCWRCAALITVYACVGVDDDTLLYRSSHVFHKEYRSANIIVSRLELDNDDTKGLHNTSGEAAVRDSNFTKPSELSNVCIAFKNTDMHVFVNKEYLLINSRKFATLFTAERAASAASNLSNLDKSESGDDFDVLSSRASVPEQSLENSGLSINLLSSHGHGDGVPSTAGCHEEGVFLLEDVNIKDFITFLETIYPPFKDITGENVESVLSTAFRFDVEHIVKKCEVYLGTEDARKLFDLLQRLVFATTYKLSSLQKDSLASLQNARDVLLLLDDPRLQNASPDLRSLLLETLLERFRSESRTATPEADAASTNSDF